MRLEGVRIVTDWLKDENFGVNVYIPLVPRDAGDDAPPLISLIVDETRDDVVVDRLEPPKVPAIYVMAEGQLDVMGSAWPDGNVRDTSTPLQLAIRYLTRQANLVRAEVEAEYTLRAVVRSLRELMRNENAVSRTRNGICLEAMVDPLSYFPVVEAVGESRVTGAIVANLTARDGNPSF